MFLKIIFQITDLVTGAQINVRRETGELVGARESDLCSVRDVFQLLKTGHARKRFAATAMNDRSSRSHTVFVLQITQSFAKRQSTVRSQLHLVDLAGSERVKKSKVDGTRLREAVGINSSLLVLGKVFYSLLIY